MYEVSICPRYPNKLKRKEGICWKKMMYRSPESSPQDSRDGFFFVQCPGLIFLAARLSGPAASASIFSVCLDYIL